MSRLEPASHPPFARNLAKLQRFIRGAAIATLLGVLVCAQTACLIPQGVDPAEPTPGRVPQILAEDIPGFLLTPVLTLIRQGTADAASTPPCHCVLTFEQLFVEADPNLRLVAKWFVDYDVNVPSSTVVRQSETLDPIFNDPTQTTRPLRAYKLDADAVGIVQSGPHVVEVVVGELDGFDDSPSARQPNRSMKEGYLAALYRFAVNVHLEQVTGQCPRTPPSSCQ